MQGVPLDTPLTIAQVTRIIAPTYGKSTLRAFAKSGVLRATLVDGRGRGTYYVTLTDLLHFCQEMEIVPDLSSLSLTDFPQAVEEPPIVAPPPPPPAVPSRIVVMPPSVLTEQLARTGSFFQGEGEDEEDEEQEDYDEQQDDGYEEVFTPTWSQEHEFMFIERLNIVLCKFCPLAYHFEKETNSGTPLWVMVRVPIR